MIKIIIDNTNYNIPSEWSDVKLSEYENWFESEIQTKEDEALFVSKVSGIDFTTLQSLPLSFYNDLLQMIAFSLKDSKTTPKNSILINDAKYSINSENQLTLGEWVDVEETLKGENNKLSQILAIICRPTGERYNSENLSSRIELFKNITMDKLFPLFGFFLRLNEQCKIITNLSLKVVEMENQLHQVIKSSAVNGVGLKQSRNWVMTILGNLTKSLNYLVCRFLITFPTLSTKIMHWSLKGSLKNK